MKRRKTKFSDNIKKPSTICNYDIRETHVRIVGADGEQIGVKPTDVGIKMARSQGLDLAVSYTHLTLPTILLV